MDASHTSENPFCTRRVRPGAIPFVFPQGQNAKTLIDRLQRAGWRGEIVGEHGTGKSALLAALIPAIQQAGHPTVLIELHDGQRQLPLALRSDPRLRPPAVLIVDGYEQLSRWNRLVLRCFCRWRGVGLLVTAHESVRFPELFRTVATDILARQIVGELMGGRESPFTLEEVSQCLARRDGDLREMLFDLYDIYEQRRPSS